MRSEQQILDLVLDTARRDERIRAVILNGSRANPAAHRDFFQDFDIVYVVREVSSFKRDPGWISRFGELMILQLPDDMGPSPAGEDDPFAYLMQFMDGNRIDLGIFPASRLAELEEDSLSVLMLDKDGLVPPFDPANESGYLPKPPSSKEFADCCNEFWWVCPYVAKGLWREELPYAKYMLDQVFREQLMKMLAWQIGVQTGFARNPGKYGKYFQQYLAPEQWQLLEKTYSDASYANTWEALFAMGDLFRLAAWEVGRHFSFAYPQADDRKVTAHLQHVRRLPRDAREMD